MESLRGCDSRTVVEDLGKDLTKLKAKIFFRRTSTVEHGEREGERGEEKKRNFYFSCFLHSHKIKRKIK